MDCKIRKAEARDADMLLFYLGEIAKQHNAGRKDIFKCGSIKYTKEDLLLILQDESKPIFVAERDKKVVGYIMCKYRNIKADILFRDRFVFYIDDLYVDHLSRGERIGSSLMDIAVAAAKEKQCDAVELNVWEFNKDAIAFYEKYGMKTQRRILELNI